MPDLAAMTLAANHIRFRQPHNLSKSKAYEGPILDSLCYRLLPTVYSDVTGSAKLGLSVCVGAVCGLARPVREGAARPPKSVEGFGGLDETNKQPN